MKFNKKTIITLLAVLSGLFIVVVIAIVILFINTLPSPQSLAKKMDTEKQQTKNNEQNKNPTLTDSNSLSKNETSDTAAQAENPSTTTTAEEKKHEANKTNAQNLKNMINEDPKDLKVCENLGHSEIAQRKGSEQNTSFDEIFTEKARQDSAIEPYRFAVRSIFQDEALSPLLKELTDYSIENDRRTIDDSLTTKAYFYSRVAYAVTKLYANRAKFEYIGNRAEHLAVIARLAAVKPEFANDPKIVKFCWDIQNSVTDGTQSVNLKDERLEVLKMIEYAGLTPKDLSFNPENYIKFSVKNDNDQISFSLSGKDVK